MRARTCLLFCLALVLMSGCSVSRDSNQRVTSKIFAHAGQLDPTFGIGGKVTTQFGRGSATAHALILQPDGRIVAAGYAGGNFALARYNPDGTLDPTFGTGGKATNDFSGRWDIANALMLQPDGRIVAAGRAGGDFIGLDPRSDFALARYNPDGTLDTTFGAEGKVTSDFAGFGDSAYALVLQPDGKIVAGGDTRKFSDREWGNATAAFALARYNPDGTLDSTFGTGGKVSTTFLGRWDGARALMVQPDGRIVAAGRTKTSDREWRRRDREHYGKGTSDFALARYNPDGTLDPTFGSAGKVTTDISGTHDEADALLLQPDGRIVAAGRGGGDFALARYKADGTLDPSFGKGGLVTTIIGYFFSATAQALILQPDGKIVAAGSAGRAGGADFALARYNPDGTLDPTFGTGGKVITEFSGQGGSARGLILQPDGMIVAAGGATTISRRDPQTFTATSNFALARFTLSTRVRK